MFLTKRIVVVVPAGRKQYLEILIEYLLKLREVIDEVRFWINTINENDIKYMESVNKKYPDFITLEYLTIKHNNNLSIYSFFKNCKQYDTVYVRFDDDVVMIDDIDAFKSFLKFRIENSNYFLVYANILNNAVISHLHNRFGTINTDKGIAGYSCLDNLGWKNPEFAINLHNQILTKNDLKSFRFNKFWILHHYERVSINCISWLGEEFAKFDGIVGQDEEQWLSSDKPKLISKKNVIFGDFVVVHYSFFTQRSEIDKTDILSRYKNKLENKETFVDIN